MFQITVSHTVSDKLFTSVTEQILNKCLTVYKTENKIRLGGKENHPDGGYIIEDNLDYDILISAGIDDDVTFEKAFTEKYGVRCFAFDGESADKARKACKEVDDITHIPKNVGSENTTDCTDLKEYINKFHDVFLKMDIEGAEFSFINSLTANELNRIKQITIEFHYADIIHKWKMLEKLCDTHYLIHFHANNNNKIMYNYNYTYIPAVFECTYVRKSEIDNPQLNDVTLPIDLDMQNTPGLDFRFDSPPWVHKK
jgi:hypothetical protein